MACAMTLKKARTPDRLKSQARRLCSPTGLLHPAFLLGSEFGWQIAVDFEPDADFYECWSGPVHSHLLMSIVGLRPN
jgi:hypothetical protein